MRKEQQEIQHFLQEIQIKGIKAVIFPESFFFSDGSNGFQGLEDQSEIFKDFHLFIDLVKGLVLQDVKIHIQTNPNIQERFDRFSIFEMICDMTAINRHRLLQYLMFYYDMTIPQITSRLIKNLKPSFGINILGRGIRGAKNILTFNYKNNAQPNPLRPDEIAIVLDPSFSFAQRENLLLGNYRVIELPIFYNQQQHQPKTEQKKKLKHIKNAVKLPEKSTERQTPIDEILRSIPSPTIQSRNSSEANSQYLVAKSIYDEFLKIYNQLKHRSQEFSRSAVELKMKSDRQKEVLENIESMIEKNIAGMDLQDLNDAKLQCQKEIATYNQQCKDFFDLYVQISEQASEAKQDLLRAESELKKYSS